MSIDNPTVHHFRFLYLRNGTLRARSLFEYEVTEEAIVEDSTGVVPAVLKTTDAISIVEYCPEIQRYVIKGWLRDSSGQCGVESLVTTLIAKLTDADSDSVHEVYRWLCEAPSGETPHESGEIVPPHWMRH